MKRFALLVALAGSCLAAPAMAATIVSANFENGYGTLTASGGITIADGSTYQPCCGTSPTYTNKFAAFGGGNQASGMLSQAFDTVLGRAYTFSFRYGALGGGSEPLTVSVGGVERIFTPTANNNLFAAFSPGTFSFVGNGLSTALSITSGGVDGVDAIVDDVSVTSVPEPATWGMMILGFGAVGASMRRRKSAVRTSVRFA